ncbi:hypothetical protein HRI_000485200 [Hibiscus trionum]|uniref:RNase H type-1 domain-containing protein n=1 Tax=Hibiscus trionum TaxID=183268 RepID=A0A9W7GZ55_HIBTR|nr:hypothetical protein HRI_000485200 [Hibiscus trionum]
MVAVELVKVLGFSRVLVEGDSLTIIKKLNSFSEDLSSIRPLILDIKEAAKGLQEVHFRFVHREANNVVHTLAREGRLHAWLMYWIEEAPLNTTLAAEKDRQQLNNT